jgi:hypothetical protein
VWVFGGADDNFKRAALNLVGLGGINEVSRWQDERARGENLSVPMVGESQVDIGLLHDGTGWRSEQVEG